MSRIGDVRAALATALGAIDGLRASAYEPDKVSPPQAIVGDLSIDYDQTFGSAADRCHKLDITVRVYVPRATDRAGQDKLDGYVSPTGASSIKAALEADKTLGGVIDDLHVPGMSGYGFYEVGGVVYMGAEFTVSVLATGV